MKNNQALARQYEEKIQEALKAIKKSHAEVEAGTATRPLSLRQAALDYGVSKTTLTARWNNRKTRQEAHEHQQKIPPVQEGILVAWIQVLGRRGIPLSPATVCDYASKLAGETLGDSWLGRFRERHPEIKVRWTTTLEQCRARALNRTLVAEFFDIIYEQVVVQGIPPENIYNMDEKGLLLGTGKSIRAFVDRDQKTVNHVEGGCRELVTAVECISADGVALQPAVIYKAARRDLLWGSRNPCNAR